MINDYRGKCQASGHVLGMAGDYAVTDRMPEEKEHKREIELPQIKRVDPPRHYLSLVAIVRDEASYLDEWINFHRLVGVDHFYLYDDGSTDETAELLAAYAAGGVVTAIPWGAKAETQRAAYAHALSNFGRYARWMMFIDADEFVFPARCDSLPEVLGNYEDLPSLVLPWRMFGYSGHKQRPSGLIVENYVRRAATLLPKLRKVKSIVDPTRVRGVHVHAFPTDIDAFYTPTRSLWSKNYSEDGDDHILINHYFTKSEAEFAAKSSKTPVDRDVPEQKEKMARAMSIEMATVEDNLIQRFVPALKERMRHLDDRGDIPLGHTEAVMPGLSKGEPAG